jgi:hypothetical protein
LDNIIFGHNCTHQTILLPDTVTWFTPSHCHAAASQALCVCTLGSEADAQRIDSIRGDVSTPDSSTDEDSSGTAPSYERFYLQYFFPPSSVGECGRVGPAGGPF